MKIDLKVHITSILILSFWVNAFSQNAPLVTDRPDITESALVIPKGFIQLEAGASFEQFKESSLDATSLNVPTFLLRVGLNNRVELRLGSTYSFFDDKSESSPNDATGFNASELGVKIDLNDNKTAKSKHALIAAVGVPYLAAAELRSSSFTSPTILYLVQFDVCKSVTFSSNIGGVWSTDNGEGALRYSGSFGYSLSDKLGAFTEVYGNVLEGGSNRSFFDLGFTYLLNNRMQLDLSGGAKLHPDIDYSFISMGFSWLFPYNE